VKRKANTPQKKEKVKCNYAVGRVDTSPSNATSKVQPHYKRTADVIAKKEERQFCSWCRQFCFLAEWSFCVRPWVSTPTINANFNSTKQQKSATPTPNQPHQVELNQPTSLSQQQA
jgi:hypothetical protein